MMMLATGLVWGRTALLWFLTIAVAVFSWRFMVGGVEATMEFVAYHAQLRPIAFFAHVAMGVRASTACWDVSMGWPF
jgi:hypothetical protein